MSDATLPVYRLLYRLGGKRKGHIGLSWLFLMTALFWTGSVGPKVTPERTMSHLRSRAALVVIAPEPVPREDGLSETYADWAGYLNDFASTLPPALRVTRMTAPQWQALATKPAPDSSYASIFLRPDGEALIYRGMILEPELYRVGAAWAAGRIATAPRDGGFVMTRVQWVKSGTRATR